MHRKDVLIYVFLFVLNYHSFAVDGMLAVVGVRQHSAVIELLPPKDTDLYQLIPNVPKIAHTTLM